MTTLVAKCLNCTREVFLDEHSRWRHALGSKDVLCWVTPPVADPDPATVAPGVVKDHPGIPIPRWDWPTNRLKEAERALARFCRTLPEDPDELVYITPEQKVWLGVASQHVSRIGSPTPPEFASAMWQQVNPPESAVEAVRTGLRLIGCLHDGLADGMPRADIIGNECSYAAMIEAKLGEAFDLWERAEWAAGRPRMTEKEAVADIAERLRW